MNAGLPTSIGLHVSLLALALLSWGRAHDDAVPTEIPVEITIGDVTVNRLGERNAPKAEEITPKSTKQAAKEREGKRAGDSKQEEPPPPPSKPQEVASLPKQEPVPEPPKEKPEPPKPVAKPEPKPEPKVEPPKPEVKPEEKPKLAEKAPEIAKEPPPPKPEPPKKEPPKPEPPKESKDSKSLDKLIADAKESPKPAPAKPTPSPQVAKADPAKTASVPSPAKADNNSKTAGELSDIVNKALIGTAQGPKQQQASLGSPNGVNAKVKMSSTELDAFMGQVQKCWNPPPGASEANLVARIRVVLQQDGSLGAQPALIEATSHPMGPAYANSAIRAIRMCAPYSLPAAKFADWQDNTLTFVPVRN